MRLAIVYLAALEMSIHVEIYDTMTQLAHTQVHTHSHTHTLTHTNTHTHTYKQSGQSVDRSLIIHC